ncbi:MAG: WYL domain-containing protein [Peptococcaceae bacterium]|jgi:hypothetical protein|nr:WYL domain-containing protein [Peptococcaceae bacterium]
MLFNEVYGSYFNAVAAILKEAVSGNLSGKRVTEIAREKAFAESVLTIPASLRSKDWPLLDDSLRASVRRAPTMPLTALQKRWLKALLSDPRIKLFSPRIEGLDDIEPLYTQDMLVFFDRYSDGDPYEDSDYIKHFQTILTALREKKKLRVRFIGHLGTHHSWLCVPYRLEYSSKDDKFRLITASPRDGLTVNLARIKSCELLEPYTEEEYQPPQPRIETLTFELKDERNALERAMLHFSDLEKRTERLEDGRYRVTLQYERDDTTELLIRILSFGPMLRVVAPESFIAQIRERLNKQISRGQTSR